MFGKFNFLILLLVLHLVAFPAYAQQGNAIKRHYINQCNDDKFIKVIKGMTRKDVRLLVGGVEYIPFETVHGGFSFALDNNRSHFYVFPGWMPPTDAARDFFVSDKNILYVRYDKQNKIDALAIYPLNGKIPSSEAGVQIKQKDERTLQLTVSPLK